MPIVHEPGQTYRTTEEVVVKGPNVFVKLLGRIPAQTYVAAISVALISVVVILTGYFDRAQLEVFQYPLDRAEINSTKTLYSQGYKEIIKSETKFKTFEIGSGCFSKNIQVTMATKNINNKYTEVALCCSDKEGCFLFSVKEF